MNWGLSISLSIAQFQPSFKHGDYILFFQVRERVAFAYAMPFLQAAAAAGGGGMLGDEHGVAAPGRLFAVLGGIGGRQTLLNEILGMGEDDV